MVEKIDDGIFLELVKTLYNKHHNQLSQELKAELLRAVKAIEAKESLGLAAMRLNRWVRAEIRYYHLGRTAPNELVDLARFLEKHRGVHWSILGLLPSMIGYKRH